MYCITNITLKLTYYCLLQYYISQLFVNSILAVYTPIIFPMWTKCIAIHSHTNATHKTKKYLQIVKIFLTLDTLQFQVIINDQADNHNIYYIHKHQQHEIVLDTSNRNTDISIYDMITTLLHILLTYNFITPSMPI